VGFRFDKPDFETPLVVLRLEPLVMLEVPPRYLMLKLEKYFMDKVAENYRVGRPESNAYEI
jgi:hypothetical protein